MPYKTFDVPDIGLVTIYKRRGSRSLRLSVTAGGVRVTIPFWTPYQAGLNFVQSRQRWIQAQPHHETTLLQSGFPVGKTRRLIFMPIAGSNAIKTSVRQNEVVIMHPVSMPIESAAVQTAAEKACWRGLKQESVTLLTPRLNQLAAQYGFTFRSVRIKRMKTRWGSCDQHSNLVFNLFLVQLPWELIDYVILHELTHTRVLNHGADFWDAMERVCPNARALRRAMRSFQPKLSQPAKQPQDNPYLPI